MLRKFGLLLLTGLLLSGCQTPLELLNHPRAAKILPAQGGFLYEISKADSGDHFYLFGTIHLSELNDAKKPAIPLKPSVLKALANSDRLLVENYESKPAPRPASSPATEVRDPTLEKLSAEGVGSIKTGSLKKIFDLCNISVISVDSYLVYLAQKQSMPIAGLETREDRYRILAGAGSEVKQSKSYQGIEALQAFAKLDVDEFLQKGGPELKEKLCGPMQASWRSWKEQDIQSQQSKSLKQSQKDAFNRALFTERSQLFYQRIQQQLKLGGHPFIAVGVGHLYDEAGLVGMFAANGYTVQFIAE